MKEKMLRNAWVRENLATILVPDVLGPAAGLAAARELLGTINVDLVGVQAAPDAMYATYEAPLA